MWLIVLHFQIRLPSPLRSLITWVLASKLGWHMESAMLKVMRGKTVTEVTLASSHLNVDRELDCQLSIAFHASAMETAQATARVSARVFYGVAQSWCGCSAVSSVHSAGRTP